MIRLLASKITIYTGSKKTQKRTKKVKNLMLVSVLIRCVALTLVRCHRIPSPLKKWLPLIFLLLHLIHLCLMAPELKSLQFPDLYLGLDHQIRGASEGSPRQTDFRVGDRTL